MIETVLNKICVSETIQTNSTYVKNHVSGNRACGYHICEDWLNLDLNLSGVCSEVS